MLLILSKKMSLIKLLCQAILYTVIEYYIKMKNESAYNEMSYSEKRKKDKEFGKLIKSVVKSKNR